MFRRILALGVAAGVTFALAAYAADPAGPDYVGMTKCKMCHAKQYKAWAETKHAKAFASLKAADEATIKKMADTLKAEVKDHPETNEACVSCHVTGYKKPGGYPAADSLKTAAVTNVTCEACHGPGSKHVKSTMAEKKKTMEAGMPTAATCQTCHTAEISPKFDFDATKKGVHPVAAAPAK